jgi:hypothetical protein
MIPTRKELKLQEFGEIVLQILEDQKEWDADTTDDIANMAYEFGLAETDENGKFAMKEEFTA